MNALKDLIALINNNDLALSYNCFTFRLKNIVEIKCLNSFKEKIW